MRVEVMAAMGLVLAFGCKPPSRSPVAESSSAVASARSPMGWRCPPGASACVDRADLAGPFACAGERCVQSHPVMPDDGEWTCGESGGVTTCTAGETAAGVAPTGIAPGWVCGSRRGKGKERVCRDASPDFPDGKPTGWRCSYDGPALPRRVCVRDSQNHTVGDACDARHPCVDGAVCRDGVCALAHRAPTCWVDEDCNGPCRFGSCPGDPVLVQPAASPPAASKVPAKSAASVLDFGSPQTQVGFDAEFTITVTTTASLRPARIAWRQLGGPALPELRASADGFRVTGRTVSWQTALGKSEAPWGVVPVSPRTRGEAVLEATWDGANGKPERSEVIIAAAALSRGLTTVPVGARIYLGGGGWRVVRPPDGSHATIEDRDGLAGFLPDLAGVWRLRDGDGRGLDIIAGRYDDVPLDCSRARCHAEMLAGSLVNPMTTVMARLLDGFPPDAPGRYRAAEYPRCALACHATGQPGISDGGFDDVGRTIGWTGQERTRWPEMPRMLRRLGGAGCLSCHGPGAVPDARSSWTTLRGDVCAICHDAPPVYQHVAAWRRSANAHADRDPDAANKPGCVRCHTTWGFLLAEKPSKPDATASQDRLTFMASLRPPPQAGPIGIACAACHDSHPTVDAAGKTPHALLRKVAHPVLLPALPPPIARRSEICLPCHTPDMTSDTPPFASAAAIWLGRGGLDPTTGSAMNGPSPLATLAGGCLQCHIGEPSPRGGKPDIPDDNGVRGGNHTFAANVETCPDCPPIDLKRPDGVQARARQLYLDARLYRVLGDVRPLHASKTPLRRNTPASRALWNLLLLLEDKAAEAHNPPYAKALLESAESILRSPASVRELVRRRR